MSKRDYASISAWCEDAHAVLAQDLPERIAALVSESIQRFTGKPQIVDIAKDLAEGLSHLPSERRSSTNVLLKTKHGFGYDYFVNRTRDHLIRVVARGFIQTEKEHRAVLAALSDTTLDSDFVATLEGLALERERELGAT